MDSAERTRKGDGSASRSNRSGGAEARLKGWKGSQVVASGWLGAIDEGDTEFGGGDGSDIGLAETAPVDLHEIGVRTRCEVLADADARVAGRAVVKTSKPTD